MCIWMQWRSASYYKDKVKEEWNKDSGELMELDKQALDRWLTREPPELELLTAGTKVVYHKKEHVIIEAKADTDGIYYEIERTGIRQGKPTKLVTKWIHEEELEVKQ